MPSLHFRQAEPVLFERVVGGGGRPDEPVVGSARASIHFCFAAVLPAVASGRLAQLVRAQPSHG
jgi:hypothetical protein